MRLVHSVKVNEGEKAEYENATNVLHVGKKYTALSQAEILITTKQMVKM